MVWCHTGACELYFTRSNCVRPMSVWFDATLLMPWLKRLFPVTLLSLTFCCRKPKLCCSHKHYYCGFQCRFNFYTLFLIFSADAFFNSGSLSTLEPGISSVYLCQRAHSATYSYTLDDRLQGELDDFNVNSFLNILLASLFHMFDMPTGPDVETQF